MADTHRTTILVLEDEEGVRLLVRLALERAGFQVILACDGQEGVELFRQHGPAIDAVLLDLTMPRLSGLEVIRILRRDRPDLPILATSGFTEHELRSQCAAEGVSGFLEKPFLPTDLLKALRQVLGS